MMTLVSRKRLSEDEIEDAALRYRAGTPMGELTDELGVTAEGLRYHFRRMGIAPNRKRRDQRVLTEAERADICELYQNGTPTNAIARKHKTAQYKVAAVLRETGVKRLVPVSRPRPKQGRIINSRGYVLVLVPADSPFASMRNEYGYVLEHRLVMAQRLSRPLLPTETVHHINGIRDDNCDENLQLRIGAHGAGVAMECHDCGSQNVRPVRIRTAMHDERKEV